MPGIQKTGSLEISNLNTVSIPIIRKITPSIFAAHIVGVQPMSMPSGIIFVNRWNNLIRKYPPFMSTMVYVHVTTREFMPDGAEEPNEHYRPWLEQHVGKQGIDWNWDLNINIIDLMDIGFASREHATLFELTWP
jgi:hypothetical protein